MQSLADGIYIVDDFFGLNSQEIISRYTELVRTPPASADCFTDNGIFKNRKFIDPQIAQHMFDTLTTYQRADRDREFLRPNKYIMTGHYSSGDSFGLHTDTGLYYNVADKEASSWTLLIYLNHNFKGGATTFYTDRGEKTVSVQPLAGRALLFDIRLWHKGEPVESGEKLWIGCEIIGRLNPGGFV